MLLRTLSRKLPRRGRTPWRLWVRHTTTLVAWGCALGVIALSVFIINARRNLPDPSSLATRQVKESTKIYDRTGTALLYEVYNEERRTVVSYDKISDNVKQATVAVEDANFYYHHGFDIKGFLRSLLNNIKLGYGQGGGGSTITQQLAGNALVGRQKTLTRKVQELILALEVEQRYTKEEILGMYLNQIPYGANAYGIEAAAETYFSIHASDLDLAQSALLAALPQSPSHYLAHTDELLVRKNFILDRMLELGMIDQGQHDAAKTEPLTITPKTTTLAAPHFAIMARQYAIEKYGQDMVESGGLKIITTLDADLQQQAQDLVSKYAAINKQKYKANNAALVAIDPKDGGVRALVGSANYTDVANQGNFNVILSPNRQPGSAFKPFAYAVAFQKGYPDSTMLWDVKTEFNPLCPADASAKKDPTGQDCYHPQDYSGTYGGPVTMRQSLARSLNVPSVETLYLAGVPDTIDLATNMGITTLGDRSRFGLSLVLGGAEVRPIDLASAYGVFANDGIRIPWGFIDRIETADGTVLEQRQVTPTRVVGAQTSRLITDVLSDNNARSAVFGVNNSLVIPGIPVAAKTGTTQENRDAWVVGYNPSLVTGVWVGNNDNTSMSAAGAGISAAGPLWNAFMTAALKRNPVEYFTAPDPVVTNKIMLNGSITSPQNPTPHSILYYVDRNDPEGAQPSAPETDAQFSNWEFAVNRYVSGI